MEYRFVRLNRCSVFAESFTDDGVLYVELEKLR